MEFLCCRSARGGDRGGRRAQRRGLTGDDNDTFRLFGASNDLPGDVGRNVFPRSILEGSSSPPLESRWCCCFRHSTRRRGPGWSLLGLAGLMLVTNGTDGTVIALG